MDIVSHGLIGLVVKKDKAVFSKQTLILFFFGILPDLLQIPLYLFVGFLNNRFLWIPQNNDWIGFRELHPIPSMLWEVPHSFLFLLLVIMPLLMVFKKSKWYALPYFLHIFVDIFTHTGEWATKPFFPLNIKIEGFVDAWIWPWYYYLFCWAVIIFILFQTKRVRYLFIRT